MREPESMDECIYYTRRTIGDGSVVAWVFKQDCPSCGKAKMGKPVEKGKVKIRAKEYVCPECGHTVGKDEYEPSLSADIKYTCPKCKHSGSVSIPFKRKKVALFDPETDKKKMVDALQIQCEKCSENINITKKMK